MVAEEQEQREEMARRVLQEDRYLWMARAFVVTFVLAVVCDLILLIALSNVVPVMRVQPFYVEAQNKEQQVVFVNRANKETLDSDALKESFVREYILSRYGVDSDLSELEERWGIDGPVFWMSDQSVYDEFVAKEQIPLQALARQDNLTRKVFITSLNKLPPEGRTEFWKVEFDIIENDRVSDKPKTSWVAEVGALFRPVQTGKPWKDRLKNPLGFTVVSFGLARKSKEAQ